MGVSVVPTRVCPCHGMANITRPSEVCGTMMALSPGRNERSNTRWMPWLGEIIGLYLWVRQPPYAIGKSARRVHDYFRANTKLSPGLDIAAELHQ